MSLNFAAYNFEIGFLPVLLHKYSYSTFHISSSKCSCMHKDEGNLSEWWDGTYYAFMKFAFPLLTDFFFFFSVHSAYSYVAVVSSFLSLSDGAF